MVDRRTSRRTVVRLAALKRVTRGQWFELSLTRRAMGRTVFRTLVAPGSGRRVLRTIMQLPGQQPLELPAELARKHKPPFPGHQMPRFGPWRVIRVPAGRFRTRYFTEQKAGSMSESWFDPKGAWPLIRYRDARVHVELMASGRRARSEVRGRVGRFHPRLLGGVGSKRSRPKPK